MTGLWKQIKLIEITYMIIMIKGPRGEFPYVGGYQLLVTDPLFTTKNECHESFSRVFQIAKIV